RRSTTCAAGSRRTTRANSRTGGSRAAGFALRAGLLLRVHGGAAFLQEGLDFLEAGAEVVALVAEDRLRGGVVTQPVAAMRLDLGVALLGDQQADAEGTAHATDAAFGGGEGVGAAAHCACLAKCEDICDCRRAR